jgi:hypothetical protein
MKKLLIIYALSVAISPQNMHGQIVEISMMKAGTHLLLKLITALTEKQAIFHNAPVMMRLDHKGKQDVINIHPRDFNIFSNLKPTEFWVTHTRYVEKYAQVLSKPDYQILFIYRDPRDVVVSLALFIRTQDKRWWPGAQEISLDETITRLIEGGQSMHVTSYHISKLGIKKTVNAYLPWMNLPNTLSIRFEDLVGPQGGGSQEKQISTIMAIAHHIGQPISEDEAVYYGNSIFGGTFSFNKGQIGSWKEYFTPEQIQLFKEHAGQLLIDLGYEKDLNW